MRPRPPAPLRPVLRIPAALTLIGCLAAWHDASAGDILRGGAAMSTRPARDPAAAASAAAAKEARANARDALSKTSQALQTMRNLQAATAARRGGANNLGQNPNSPGATLPDVPDGLAAGGLKPGGGTWQGALQPTSRNVGGLKAVTVKQTSAQALLNWETFNVGRNTSLYFDQSAGGASAAQWIAFNRINDPTGSPTQIIGSISAPGQVYIINQNGIIFGAGSQVNTHTLVASSLPINENLISRGLLNQSATAQFLFSALPQAGDVPFTPPPLPASGKIGDVIVQEGALISAPTSEANVGGRVALVGPNVVNRGHIRTPDGQTILAAGMQVGFAAHSSADASLRGLDTYVGEVGSYGGAAVNEGLIETPRGNATITGKDVRQLGVIESSTSVALNGRIDLRAEYDAVANLKYDPVTVVGSTPFLYGGGPSGAGTGTVTIGSGSIIRILPEWGSADKVPGTELALRSQVNARGRVIHMGSGAVILAPNGNVAFNTGVWDYVADPNRPVSTFVRSAGQIYIDQGALINVAGTTDAQSPLEQHILTVILRSSELADSPLQRDTFFRGGEVTVDLRRTGTFNGRTWVGTPLADLTGYLGLIERTVAELTVAGGSVTLNSGGSIIVRDGARIDTSAGWVNYSEGMVRTTRLLQDGRLVDIADAAPDQLYTSIYTGQFVVNHPKWGITHTYTVPWMTGEHFEQGYLSGAAAGAQALAGSSMALDGAMLARAVSGPRQTVNPAKGGSLDLSFEVQELGAGSAIDPLYSPTPPSVVFEDRGQSAPAPFGLDENGNPLPLRADRVARVTLSPELLTSSGFASLGIRNPDGNITVPEGVRLTAQSRGSIRLEGANVTINGDITAPGGTLAFSAYNISPAQAAKWLLSPPAFTPTANPGRGVVSLGSGASLNTAGLVVDHRPGGSTPFLAPAVTDGGTVSIKGYTANLSSGSVIDVSGGVLATPRGAFTYGKAGSIEILTGQDLSLPVVGGGRLRLGATLKGYSGTATGGSLSLQASMISIGGGGNPLGFHIGPDFFNQGGFSTFTLTGFGGTAREGVDEDYTPAVLVADGTTIRPRVKGWLALPFGGPNGALKLIPFDDRPEGLRATSNISLVGKPTRNLTGTELIYRGDVVLGRGASITTDALGTIRLAGDTVAVYGSLTAPGGRVTLTGENTFPTNSPPAFPQATVYIAPSARISTVGTVLTQQDMFGRRIGTVLPGGAISVSGNIIAAAGAVLDVSGYRGEVDAHPHQLGLDAYGQPLETGTRLVPHTSGLTSPLWAGLSRAVTLETNGGSIQMRGGQMLFTDATLRGEGGGDSALGGLLSLSSGRYIVPGSDFNTAQTNFVVTQSGVSIPVPFTGSAIGETVRDANGVLIPGMGYFAADTFARGGFASLSLGGNVEFRGPVTIHADKALQVATGGVIRADSLVTLTAEYAALGKAFSPPLLPTTTPELFTQTINGTSSPYFFPPTFGAGELRVTAGLIDVGTLSLDGIGLATLTARDGDIRGNGTLQMAGRLNLTAGQVYPTTGSPFNIVVYSGGGQPGTIWIESSGTRDLPLSAAGTLNLHAENIHQGGVLRAPFGAITLGWDGTGTAPFVNPIAGATAALPVTTDLTLAPGSQTSVSAVDPRTGRGILIPYGIVEGGESWIAPSGLDITALGPPEKRISLGATHLTTQTGSLIDVRGGGDLFAYRWVPGTGGSQDVLASQGSYAIIPGYGADFSPFAPFNTGSDAFGTDTGYANSSLAAGDKIYLGPNEGVPAGVYTLLPARYALLPGAFLVTPKSGAPVGSFTQPDGSFLASGYRFGAVDPGTDSALQTRFEVAPGSVVRQRSLYEEYTGDNFFRDAAEALNLAVPRLPGDSGRLILQATQGMNLAGRVEARPLGGGRGALVDISSPLDIVIGTGGAIPQEGSLFLDASQLNSFGAESLLVGGIRTFTSNGVNVSVNTGSLTLDNAGAALTGGDIILVAKNALALADGAQIITSGGGRTADALKFGDPATPGSGNGLMVRAAADPNAVSTRDGVAPGGSALLSIGDGALLRAGSLTLDSTAGASLHPGAVLDSRTVQLSSGRISVSLDNPGELPADSGLVLEGGALDSLQQNVTNLGLLSYTTIDLYGTGTLTTPGSLRLSAAALRGFNQNGGAVTFNTGSVTLDNRANAVVAADTGDSGGNLEFNAGQITLGTGNLRVERFRSTALNATQGLLVSGTGSFRAGGDLTGALAGIAAGQKANHSISAGGALRFTGIGGAEAPASALGGTLAISGRTVDLGTDLIFPSGAVKVTSTGGDLTLSGRILANGTRQALHDLVRFTNAGTVTLQAKGGNLTLAEGSEVNVSAHSGGGDAGKLALASSDGGITIAGTISGEGNTSGASGSVEVDIRSLPLLSAFTESLDAGGFHGSRAYRVRTGDVVVDGVNVARGFSVAADAGSINVTGRIDASGRTGGTIALTARDALTVRDGAVLTAAAQTFDNAGKGGSILLEAGSRSDGTAASADARLDLQSGSVIDLSVASLVAGGATTPGSSAFLGRFSGTLHLRAPRSADGAEIAVETIGSTITGASSVLVEGYKQYDLTNSGGTITADVQNQVKSDGTVFGNAIDAMTARLLPGGAGDPLASVFVLAPGAEILNRTGDLTLGTSAAAAANDWNLADFRFGPKQAPGVLTMRAAGDIVFLNSLSDGFSGANPWLAPLMAQNPLLPVNTQSWSYRLTAGADVTGAAHGTTLAPEALAAGKGSLLLGKNLGSPSSTGTGTSQTATTASAIRNGDNLQVIRTGSGSIDISAGQDVRLLNVFASIYTAGTQVQDATSIFTAGDFTLPVLTAPGSLGNVSTPLGPQQQAYTAQYAMAGGNVTLRAGGDIARYTVAAGELIDDASRQIPTNWLYRRGYVDPLTGEFGRTGATQTNQSVVDPAASTTWWVDYSNFFQSVGALGGGNVVLAAGDDVRNVDAVAPTNARASSGRPDVNRFLELGGGDVTVTAGSDILGGTYYVERGTGKLDAGASITLESTRVGSVENYNPRSPSAGITGSLTNPVVTDPSSWIPVLLFLGKGGYDIEAKDDILLGPVANPFLTTSGIGNKYWYKSYFSTYAADSYVNVTSLAGDITHRLAVQLPDLTQPSPTLQAWIYTQLRFSSASNQNASFRQPWLRLSESTLSAFDTATSLLPATVRSTALAGNISIAGRMVLSPSATGTIEIGAAGTINGLNPVGFSTDFSTGQLLQTWTAASINVSDANPLSVPGILNPVAYASFAARSPSSGLPTVASSAGADAPFYSGLDSLFNESGSYTGAFGVTQTKQALHATGPLHANDPDPLRIYALGGDISGLTLYSPKATRIIADQDITDVALYLQNTREGDISIVSAGRDILPYNPGSALRLLLNQPGNRVTAEGAPLPGDIQIGGPGALEILAGRKLTLGSSPALADGTGDGISSIGNLRNPFLPSTGADIILGAGIGSSVGLSESGIDFDSFISQYVLGGEGQTYLSELGVTGFESLEEEQKARVALDVFYLVLRDAGRNFNNPESPGFGSYATGTAAIETLFGAGAGAGDINLSSRALKTRSGGDISIFVPGGGLTLGTSLGGGETPPGIITESGGNVSIFTQDSVAVGVLRIFTLRGGNIMIWSSEGDIAAGSSSKTVAAAPPTRVIIDPQSADVATDLAGLSTGGGIGVLATVKNVEPGDVDLIAPQGAVDAGDAGIRSSGNLNIAANTVLNAGNISVAGSSAGAPAAPSVSAPNLGGLTSASSTAGAAAAATQSPAAAAAKTGPTAEELPSLVSVEVLGYGGGGSTQTDKDEEERRRREQEAAEGREAQEAASPAPGPGADTAPR